MSASGTALQEAAVEALPSGPEMLYVEVFSADGRGRTFYEAVGVERYDAREVDLYGTRSTDRLCTSPRAFAIATCG